MAQDEENVNGCREDASERRQGGRGGEATLLHSGAEGSSSLGLSSVWITPGARGTHIIPACAGGGGMGKPGAVHMKPNRRDVRPQSERE